MLTTVTVEIDESNIERLNGLIEDYDLQKPQNENDTDFEIPEWQKESVRKTLAETPREAYKDWRINFRERYGRAV